MNYTIEEFEKERDEALLSLDETRIRAMMRKFNGVEYSQDPLIFWGGVHKAITANTALPIDFRRKSKAWLVELGLRSFDDGDLDSAEAGCCGSVCPGADGVCPKCKGTGVVRRGIFSKRFKLCKCAR